MIDGNNNGNCVVIVKHGRPLDQSTARAQAANEHGRPLDQPAGQTGIGNRFDQPADLDVGQTRLRSTHEQVLRCVIRFCVNTHFGDSAGDKEAFITYYC
jgi:hypothetical protein